MHFHKWLVIIIWPYCVSTFSFQRKSRNIGEIFSQQIGATILGESEEGNGKGGGNDSDANTTAPAEPVDVSWVGAITCWG